LRVWTSSLYRRGVEGAESLRAGMDNPQFRYFFFKFLLIVRRVKGKVHEGLYTRLRGEYNPPSKVAEDCYRDALSVYKGWYNNPRRGRFPRVYRPTVWLTPKASYNVDLDRMTVRIASVGGLSIMGCPRKRSMQVGG